MNPERLKSNLILFFFVLVSYANCGTALTYQEEQQAAQQQNSSHSNTILTALGLSAGGFGAMGWAGFSSTSLSFKSGGAGASYSINVPSWPAPGTPGTINVQLTQSGSSTLVISPSSSFSLADDMGYPVISSFSVTSGKPGTAQITHTVTNVSTSPTTTAVNVGDIIGVVNVTVTP